jgi:hypothetical protein
MRGVVEVKQYAFFTSVRVGDDRSVSRFDRFALGEKLNGCRNWSGYCGKEKKISLCMPEIGPQLSSA